MSRGGPEAKRLAPDARAVGELLAEVVDALRPPELLAEDPQQEGAELVAFGLGVLPAQLAGMAGARATPEQQERIDALLARRLADEPTAYLVGGVELRGLRFKVDRRGFIPRFDLAVLIEAGLAGVPAGATGRALDLACGIGAAGICVGHARPQLAVDLADVSADAIELARENAALLLPGREVEAFAGDLFAALPRDRRGSYRVITANPPWVPDGTELPAEVIDHEPAMSFFGGPDGLDVVRRLVAELPEWLAPGATYAQECDPSQVEKVIALLRDRGLVGCRAHQDAHGVFRVVSARRA